MKVVIKMFIVSMLISSTLLYATGTGSSIVTNDGLNVEIPNVSGVTDIVDLSAYEMTRTEIYNFKIKSLPNEESGTLYMADGTTAVYVGQSLSKSESKNLTFDPKDGFVGDAVFTYTGMDTDGNEGNIGTIVLPIIPVGTTGGSDDSDTDSSAIVIADDKLNPEMLNTLPAVDILNLTGTDGNGVPADRFIIKTLPNEASGILYMADATTAVVADQILTKDETDGLKFDPKEGFVGNALFTYQGIDANNVFGNIATVTIPVVETLSSDNNGSVVTPDHNNSEDCVCNDYNESVSALSGLGMFLMLMLVSLFGMLLSRNSLK